MMEPNPFKDMKDDRPMTEAPAATAANSPAAAPPSGETPMKPVFYRRWLAGFVVLALVFGLGFVPMWLKAGRHADERDSARREVKLLQLETVAAAAALDARRGEYEAARQSASWLFSTLSAEFDLGAQSSLSLAQENSLRPLLAHRDGLITLLARSDPASAERLGEVYLACRNALRGD